MNKIRLLQIVPTLECGGAERMVVNLMTHLDRQRVEVGAVILGSSESGPLERDLLQRGFPVWCLGKTGAFDTKMPLRIGRIVRQFRPHVVHSHLCLHYVLPALIGRKSVRHVSTLHLPGDVKYPGVVLPLTRFAFWRGVVPVAVSMEVAEWVKHVCGAKHCLMIPNGIPVSEYQRHPASRTRLRQEHGVGTADVIFVCVARLEKQKNQAMLLDAFARRFAAEPRAHLWIVGDGSCRESLEVRGRELGLEGKVRFLGRRGDVPEILGAADVFVLPSQNEGNPLALMEAMAAGLPAVATAVGGVPELIANEKTGLLVRSGDCDGLAAAMMRLFRSTEMRNTIALCAAAQAAHVFSASRMAQVYMRLYERIVDDGCAPAPKPHTGDDSVLELGSSLAES